MLETDQVILWKTLIEGDRSSFQQLMQLYYEPLFKYGTKFSADTELIKDCIQDLFLNLWVRWWILLPSLYVGQKG